MKELSLHILDIAQNSLHAKASRIEIEITENIPNNIFRIYIRDNGKGMTEDELEKVADPFYSGKSKKTGLGIPLLKQNAEQTEGSFHINSVPGKGTKITALFRHNHFDRQPLGDMQSTMISLIRSYPDIDFRYKHEKGNKEFILDLKEIRQELEGIPLDNPEVINFIKDYLKENQERINAN